MAMIRMENAACGYPGHIVLHQISLELKPGEICMIAGRNGSGKSTLLKSLCGMIDLPSGNVFIHDTSLKDLSMKQRAASFCYLGQHLSKPALPLYSYVLHGRYAHQKFPRKTGDLDRAIVMDALKKLGLEGLKDQLVCNLSGGQIQRAALALAICQQASMIFLDEPAAFLDLKSRFELLDLCIQLKKEGTGIVMVMHDLCLAMEYADRLVILDQGQIVYDGKPEGMCEKHLDEQVFGIRLLQMRHDGKTSYLCTRLPQGSIETSEEDKPKDPR